MSCITQIYTYTHLSSMLKTMQEEWGINVCKACLRGV